MPQTPVYDIECLEWTYPVAVGFFDGKDYYEFLKKDEQDDVIWRFLQFLLERGYKGIKLYAHNAAKYDAKFILAKLQEKREPIRLEAGLMRLVWLRGRITFEDSYVALPASLRDLCEAYDVPHKLEWPHEETEKPWRMPLDKLTDFRAYLKRDCMSLSMVMEAYCIKLLSKFGITPSLTLSLTAAKAFDKGFFPMSKIESNEPHEKRLRECTYGARNEVYKMFGRGVNFYDARSMFVSCYDAPMPIGKLLWTTPNIDKGSIANAKVKVPTDMYLGPLPFRHRGGLVFPVGEFEGWWDTTELRFAAELGCDITITRQLEADEAPVLKEFGEYVFQVRSESKEIESKIWKLFGLRLSGKMGQSRYQSRIIHVDDLNGNYEGSHPIDEQEEYHELTEYIGGHRSPYIKPALNVRVRAVARVRHARLLLQAWAKGDIFYCDTDSVVTSAEMPTGPGLGDLKLVNRAVKAWFIQCKFYGYVTSVGTLHQVSAGFRDFKLTDIDFDMLLDGKKEFSGTYLSLSSWRDILDKAEVRKMNRGRTISSKLGFRNRILEGQDTRPIVLPIPSKRTSVTSRRS